MGSKDSVLRIKQFSVFLLLFESIVFINSFSCQTPTSWQSENGLVQQRSSSSAKSTKKFAKLIAHVGERWPNGKVKYVLDKSLNAHDRKEVFKAFEEYHTKTCIRFESKEPQDVDFVHIEINETTCGYANVCRLGGYQFAQFGQDCRDMNAMVHELGHSLCLSHEHERQDRNQYLEFDNECPDQKTHQEFLWETVPMGLYDYQSVMHYKCDSCVGGWPTQKDVRGCGMDVTKGLSVLDADHINSLYNCQGCFRHRWLPANQMTKRERKNVYSFGYKNKNGFPIYPCRTIFRGQVVVGQATLGRHQSAKCVITYSNQVYEVRDNVEILTIPGGLSQQCYTYRLTRHTHALVADSIPAAAYNEDTEHKMYIAYGSIETWDGAVTNAIGKVWAVTEFADEAHLPFESSVVNTVKYNVLTCSMARLCDYYD